MKLPLAEISPDPAPGSVVDSTAGIVDPTPQELVQWAFARFAERRMVVTTGFGMEGCALIDMIAQLAQPATIHWIDTGFLFEETHVLRERLAAKYPQIRFERHATAITPAMQATEHGEALWERDPDLCCRIRKVEPMREFMRGADAWMTAVRRDQSTERGSTAAVEWDWHWQVVKVSPLAAWSREQVWDHVRTHGVPFNALHERGYPSIGCTHCTRPVEGARPEHYTREGRWFGSEKSECGLHGRPPLVARRGPTGVAGVSGVTGEPHRESASGTSDAATRGGEST